MTLVLGIETSCDETAAALVDSDGQVLSSVVASQIHKHAPFGGVVPEIASREHLKAFVPVVSEVLQTLHGSGRTLNAIAVTNGPGLVGALLVGIQGARSLARGLGVPVLGVNHLDGHLLAAHLRVDDAPPPPEFPFIALLISGGHTALYRVDAPHQRALLGQTRDDAAGEAFDKAAKLLRLGYPGGPIIDRLAKTGNPDAHDFPRPMLHRKDHDFSFSGLKTAVSHAVKRGALDSCDPDDPRLADLAASFQAAVVEVLAKKAIAACIKEGVPRLVLGGGVAANRGLRTLCAELAQKKTITLTVPPISVCTDNAAMIAYAGALKFDKEGAEPFGVFSRDPGRVRGKFRDDGTHVPRR